MDGLNEHLDSPLGWAALVIADHFELDEDGYSAELDDIKNVVEQSFEFIVAAFDAEELDAPSVDEVYQAAVELLQSP